MTVITQSEEAPTAQRKTQLIAERRETETTTRTKRIVSNERAVGVLNPIRYWGIYAAGAPSTWNRYKAEETSFVNN